MSKERDSGALGAQQGLGAGGFELRKELRALRNWKLYGDREGPGGGG